MRNRYLFMEEAGAEAATGGAPEPTEGQPPSQAPDSVPQPTDWRASLPPDVRDSPVLQDVPDLNTLVKNYEHTKSMVGNSVRVPTSEAGQEAIEAFTAKILEHENIPLMRKPDPENSDSLESLYRSLGRPEEASGYQAPENVDPEVFGAMAKEALELGLSRKQFETLATKQAEAQAQFLETREQERMDGVARVKGEWGPAFDEKIARATQMAESLNAPAALVEALRGGRVDGETLRFLDTVATQLGAEGTPIAQQIGQVTAETVDELEQKIVDRTQRLIKENLSTAEKQRLIDANLADRQKIIEAR